MFIKIIMQKAKAIGCATILFQAALSILCVVFIIIGIVRLPDVLEAPEDSVDIGWDYPSVGHTTASSPDKGSLGNGAEEIKVVVYPRYDVPLSADLQMFISEKCESSGIDPTIILAMIERETNYNAKAMGDGGESYGIMQIKAKYHTERMVDLDCTDLLDPYQNVTVGIDILCELLSKYDDMEMALCAYNAGESGAYEHYFSKGVYSSRYSKAVIDRAKELKGGVTYAVQR